MVIPRAAAGDEAAQIRALGSISRTIWKSALRYSRYNPDHEPEDYATKAAVEVIRKAVPKWTPDGGASWNSYAFNWIRVACQRMYQMDRTVKLPGHLWDSHSIDLSQLGVVSADAPIGDDTSMTMLNRFEAPSVDVDDTIDMTSARDWFSLVCRPPMLISRDAFILLQRIRGEKTLGQIGDSLGLSRERVRQIDTKARPAFEAMLRAMPPDVETYGDLCIGWPGDCDRPATTPTQHCDECAAQLERDARTENNPEGPMPDRLTPKRREILRYIVANPGCRNGDIVHALGVPDGTASSSTAKLRNMGLVEPPDTARRGEAHATTTGAAVAKHDDACVCEECDHTVGPVKERPKLRRVGPAMSPDARAVEDADTDLAFGGDDETLTPEPYDRASARLNILQAIADGAATPAEACDGIVGITKRPSYINDLRADGLVEAARMDGDSWAPLALTSEGRREIGLEPTDTDTDADGFQLRVSRPGASLVLTGDSQGDAADLLEMAANLLHSMRDSIAETKIVIRG